MTDDRADACAFSSEDACSDKPKYEAGPVFPRTDAFSCYDQIIQNKDLRTQGRMQMRKSYVAITGAVLVLFVGLLAWNAGATPLTASAILHSGSSSSLIEKTAGGKCIAGWHKRGHTCVPGHHHLTCPCSDNCRSCTRLGTHYDCSAQRPGGHWCP